MSKYMYFGAGISGHVGWLSPLRRHRLFKNGHTTSVGGSISYNYQLDFPSNILGKVSVRYR